MPNDPNVKVSDNKVPPAPAPKKPEAPAKPADSKTAPATESKKPDAPAKAADIKATPTAEVKKPETPTKPADSKTTPATEPKKPDTPAKPADSKAALTTEQKKTDTPAKAADVKATPTAEVKKPETPTKPADSKTTPATEPKKPDTPVKPADSKAAPTAEQKKTDTPAKSADAKAVPTAEAKKPEAPAKPADSKTTPATEPKKPDIPAKPTDSKAIPTAEQKKPDIPAKPTDSKAIPTAEQKKPDTPAKPADAKAVPDTEVKKPESPAKPADSKNVPATEPKKPDTPAKTTAIKNPNLSAVDPPKGVKITQIFSDRLEKPDDKALHDLPIPKEGEAFSMRLHPAYFYDFLEHPFTVNREVDDYKELYDSIKQNGINEPVKARPRAQGGLELLSGHRRHDIAMQLNYPVPVVIVQMDDDTARIEVVDGNLHRQDIPTSELARAAKMKMEALARKAGRRSKMEQLTSPQKRTDQIVAEDMGMSRNQVNRLVRIDSLVPELKKQVDDKKLPFNTAVELSYLKPEEQGEVVDFMRKEEVVPSMAQATKLKEVSKAAQEAEKKAARSEPPKAPFTPTAAQTPSTFKQPVSESPKPAPVDAKKIASIVKPKAEPEQKYVFTSSELKEYFPGDRQPTVAEVKRKVFDALDQQKRIAERERSKAALKDSLHSR
ncbi:ParB N-terminal domain-containing protein [Intestinimonas sp. MSJ-38]|uniref:ParB/RepB/Spo0J family partition protein n=1 Tax=Intestinimonas sp. MSJ-38 TaxID=2841532 RepID=UPI001C0F6A67|nr:ParB N-terminal domain-containing protein [Intestinimonas sp. MSJ-38]MBU5433372.1 ParB N-terminal domain-containing protein [Intestinimonas sp. MSJ-38]